MTGRSRWLAGAATALAVITGLGWFLTSESFLKRRLIHYASGSSLTLTVGHAGFSGARVVATDLVATWGQEGDQRRVRVNIGRLTVHPTWWRLLLLQVRFDKITFRTPQVTWIDDADGRKPPPTEGAFAWPLVEVDDLRVVDGSFTVVRLRAGTRAVLGVRRIDGGAREFGNTARRHDRPVRASVRAQVGFSGRTTLRVVARPTAEPFVADVDVTMKDQDLADLGRFFEPNVGLKMAGVLREGRARSRLRGPRLVTTLRGQFEGLGLSVTKTAERGPWAALATNLGITFGMKSGNLEQSAASQTQTAVTRREPDDSVASFYLRGLKDAAMSVAEKPFARELTK